MGNSLGLVGIGPANTHLVRGLVRRYGFERRVAGVIPLEHPVNEHEIDLMFDSESSITGAFYAAARAVISLGADVIVPSEALLNTALVRQGVQHVDGIPVVDAFAVMLAHAEMLVRLRRNTGLGVSHAQNYGKPDALSLIHMRTAAAATLAD
jgi:allantoin racemase